MGLIKEPIDIDLSTKSEPWTENELTDFRKLMTEIKANNAKKASRVVQNMIRPTTIRTNR
jgi:hypothetical protein